MSKPNYKHWLFRLLLLAVTIIPILGATLVLDQPEPAYACTTSGLTILIQPANNQQTSSYPEFKWNDVCNAARYRLIVTGYNYYVVQQYSDAAICSGGICRIRPTLSPALRVGHFYRWGVVAYNANGLQITDTHMPGFTVGWK